MQKKGRSGLATRVSGLVVVIAGLALPSALHALTVHDPGHAAISSLSKAELVKQLQELRKQYAELQKQSQYALNTMNKLGEITNGLSSPSYIMRQAERAAQCAIPELRHLKFPDGSGSGGFLTICEASKSVREMVLPLAEPEFQDGVELTGREHIAAVRARRDGLHEEATVKALATALSVLQTQGDTAASAEDLIDEGNDAQTIDNLLRVKIKAQAAVVSKLGSLELLLAEQVRLLASIQARNLRMTVITESRRERGE